MRHGGPGPQPARRPFPMRIVLISDTHLAAYAEPFLENAEAAIRWIEAAAPDLVIHLGDVTADGVRDAGQFETAARLFAGVSAPVLWSPGNHDVGDCPPRGGHEEPALDLGRLDAFRRCLGADAWRVERGGWTLVGLNAQLFGAAIVEEAAQQAWLDQILSEAPGPIALFLHKPIHEPGLGPLDESSRFAPPGARNELFARMDGCDVRLVASGHAHQARILGEDRARHLWVPSCAFILPDRVQPPVGEKVVGVTLLELGDDGQARAQVVVPPGVRRHDVFDHPEIYPEVEALKRAWSENR